MARRPDAPCSGCGTLLWGGRGSLPPGERMCRSCRQERQARRDAASTGAERPCKGCGTPVLRVGGRVWCEHCCRRRTCEICSADYRWTYPKQRTCGRACGWELRIHEGTAKRAAPTKISLAKATARCAQCNLVFERRSPRHRHCSPACSYRSQAANWRRRYEQKVIKVVALTCQICRCAYNWQTLGGLVRSKYCPACRPEAERRGRRAYERRREARKRLGAGAQTETVTIAYLQQRDGGRCQICRGKVPADRAVPHPLAATMDHIVPLAKGGSHTRDNLQLAHFRCNWQKRDVEVTHQAMLFG